MMKLGRLSGDPGGIASVLRSRAVRALSLATASVALAVAVGPAAHAAVDPANGRTYPYEYVAPALCNHKFVIESDTRAYDPTTGTFVAVQPGHTYRAQSLTHDTDQNKGQGDVGEVCTTFHIPAPNLLITKTADASPVNAGDQIGFTVEIKNTGNADATGASLNDPLPAGSGSGVTWAVDNSTGTPANFVLSGAQGSQTLSLASSTIPVGAGKG